MPSVLMLLTNAYEPDPRVRQEALALLGMGCTVTLLGWDRDRKHPARERKEGVTVLRVGVASTHGRGTTQLFFYAWVYLELFFHALVAPCDAIHCHDLDTLPLGWLLGLLKRKPVVYDAHESFTDMLAGSVHPQVLRWLVRLENFLIRRTDLLITVGEKLRLHFAERGARRSVVVGNWKRRGEYTRSEAENAAVRERLGIPQSALVVVCITQLLRDRKIEELLDAVDQCGNVHLILGGSGVLEPMVCERAARNRRIHYVGFVTGRDIAGYTCAAGVVYYGFDPANPNARFSAPNKLFEALAAGRPLITGDFGEIGDVVRKADCGFVLPEYSAAGIAAALNALEDVTLRERLGGNALHAGQTSMNWETGEAILRKEYSNLFGVELPAPGQMDGAGSLAAGGAA